MSLERDLAAARKALDAITASVSKLTPSMAAAATAAPAQEVERLERLIARRAEINELKAEVPKLRSELAAAQRQVKRLTKTADRLGSRSREAIAELAALKERLAAENIVLKDIAPEPVAEEAAPEPVAESA